MMFEKKVNRAMDWLKEQNKEKHVNEGYVDNEDIMRDIDFKEESTLKDEMEKKDMLALLISAFLMFTPVILLILGLIVLSSFLFF